jgi:hypothetical protein
MALPQAHGWPPELAHPCSASAPHYAASAASSTLSQSAASSTLSQSSVSFIDLCLQRVGMGSVSNFLSRGLLRVQLSQTLIHVEKKRTFLWGEHDCPISGLIDLD